MNASDLESRYPGITAALGVSNFGLAGAVTFDLNTDKAVADTVRLMREIVKASVTSPILIKGVNESLASGYGAGRNVDSEVDAARAIFYWVKHHVRFRNDVAIIRDKEILTYPDLLLSMPNPQGDCDDFSMLIATMLKIIGIDSWFVTVAAIPDMPNVLSHIYVAANLKDVNGKEERVALDGSHGPVFGWEAPDHIVYRKIEWK